MENFVKAQEALRQPIANAFANFKKVGQSKMTKGLAKSHIARLNERYDRLKQNHGNISKAQDYDSQHVYVTSDLFETISDEYYNSLGAFNDFMEQFETPALLDESLLNRTGQAPSSFNPLPKVDIPNFSGDLNDWEPFKDLFRSMIHRRTDITPVVKFHHLRFHLSGEAAELIKSLPITVDNYEVAWDILTKNYGSQRRLVSAYAKKILACRPMKSDSLQELKRLQTESLAPLDTLIAIERSVGDADFFIEFVVSKFDFYLKRDWQRFIGAGTSPPTLEQLRTFFFNQTMLLEGIGERGSAGKSTLKHSTVHASNVEKSQNTLCEEAHSLRHCPKFREKTAAERKNVVFQFQRCLNCLGMHFVKECPSAGRCRKCSHKHHSLLHVDKMEKTTATHQANAESSDSSSEEEILTSVNQVIETVRNRSSGVLLCTARVRVKCWDGEELIVRALIDQGSQCSMISQSLSDLLKLKHQRIRTRLVGPGDIVIGQPRFSVQLEVKPHFCSKTLLKIEALVLPCVSSYRPPEKERGNLPTAFQGLRLADPQFLLEDRIDMILGAEVHAAIIKGLVKRGLPHEPIATSFRLGWLLSGQAGFNNQTTSSQTVSINCISHVDLTDTLQQFWKLEEPPDRTQELSPDEIACEESFEKTHSRTKSGRFVVGLPFRINPSVLQPYSSRNQPSSKAMLIQMEKKFDTNEKLKTDYALFMREYLESKQMSEFEPAPGQKLLPHHGVVRESSSTTKLRVVFNGSSKSKDAVSLNDTLYPGPNLLSCLFDLLLRWRKYNVAFTADIEKTFRQISVREEDRKYQTIYWRFESTEPIKIFKLNTVTHGFACSPFLAIRVLKELALEGRERFPVGAEALERDVYMDDVLSGAHSEAEAKTKIAELQALTREGGFPLRKWASTNPRSLQDLNPELISQGDISLSENENSITVLGLVWQPSLDFFRYEVKIEEFPSVWTKRAFLSRLAKLFDPLGWLSPVMITAKIMMQSLWVLKLNWDDPLPESHAEPWLHWLVNLPSVNQIKIPRWNYYSPDCSKLKIHGYADASKLAYAAVVYLRIVHRGQVKVSLQLAKTKVAPLKTVSIPRLELCAAHLLSKVTAHYAKEMEFPVYSIHLWSDSRDVLHWLNELPSKWPIFIANRCADIINLVPKAIWHHVPGKHNPADIASRGIYPDQVSLLEQWYKGPDLLHQLDPVYPKFANVIEPTVVTHVTEAKYPNWKLLNDCSDLSRLCKITAYCFRFIIKLIRARNRSLGMTKEFFKDLRFLHVHSFEEPDSLILCPSEVQQVKFYWVAVHQRYFFDREIKILHENIDPSLKERKLLPSDSKLLKLDPFLDSGMIRVEGRLQNSELGLSIKHPLVLSPDKLLTTSIIRDKHIKCLHGGPRITLVHLRAKFWIIGGLQTVSSVISRCVTCRRHAGRTQTQMMGALPTPRVLPADPFMKTGIDYAGPVKVRLTKTRGRITTKGWIAVFICMCTRAIHLEIAEDYSADSFVAAFIRFSSRRGACLELYSDRGSNFIGAEKELAQMLYDYSQSYPKAQLAEINTSWHYNPPAAPHFRGIWESAVKSTKFHLKRVIGDQTLTFVVYMTLLCRIKVLLNSRPLVPMTGNIESLDVIKPAYLLTLKKPFIIPEAPLSNANVPP